MYGSFYPEAAEIFRIQNIANSPDNLIDLISVDHSDITATICLWCFDKIICYLWPTSPVHRPDICYLQQAGALSAGCNDMEMEETQAYHNQSQNNNVVQAEATQHHSQNAAQDDDLEGQW